MFCDPLPLQFMSKNNFYLIFWNGVDLPPSYLDNVFQYTVVFFDGTPKNMFPKYSDVPYISKGSEIGGVWKTKGYLEELYSKNTLRLHQTYFKSTLAILQNHHKTLSWLQRITLVNVNAPSKLLLDYFNTFSKLLLISRSIER